MSDGGIKDVLALAEAINKRSSSDERFADLLGEVSTVLADILAAMEGKSAAPETKPVDIEALSKSLAAAFVVAIKSMPAPILKVDVPADRGDSWKRIDIDLNRDASGRIGNKLTLTRT